jgi:MOSC domain-containing protein YiiM
MAKVLQINTSKTKGVIKEAVKQAMFKLDHGIEGDAHAGDWHRQVSMLGIESFEKMEMTNGELPMGSFAENLTTEGIELFTLPIGTKFRVGKEVLLEMTQIGKKCHTGCAISQLVGKCVMPQEGIFTIVLEEGTIYPGDEIVIVG